MRQVRGTAVNQVPAVENVLVTAGTGVPTSGAILAVARRARAHAPPPATLVYHGGMIDPAIGALLAGSFALLFASAALHKLRTRRTSRQLFVAYRILPPALRRVVPGAAAGAGVAAAPARCRGARTAAAARRAAARALRHRHGRAQSQPRPRATLPAAAAARTIAARSPPGWCGATCCSRLLLARLPLPPGSSAAAGVRCLTIAGGIAVAALLYMSPDRLLGRVGRARGALRGLAVSALALSNIVLWILVLRAGRGAACGGAPARRPARAHRAGRRPHAEPRAQGRRCGAGGGGGGSCGRTHEVGAARGDGRSTLLLFVSPTCPVCKTLLPAVKSSRKDERGWMDVILASDGDLKEQQDFVRAQGLESVPYVVSAALGLAYQVSRLPFAALLDEQGVLRARGLVNSREHLESLFEASAWALPRCRNISPAPPNLGGADVMHDPLTDPAFRAVIEEYEARAAREEKLWETLTPEDAGRRRDEMLLPVGHAAGVLLNLLIKEGDARRILEVGSSYGYSTHWLAAGARAVQGKVTSLELQAPKIEYARARLARAALADYVEFRIGGCARLASGAPRALRLRAH